MVVFGVAFLLSLYRYTKAAADRIAVPVNLLTFPVYGVGGLVVLRMNISLDTACVKGYIGSIAM